MTTATQTTEVTSTTTPEVAKTEKVIKVKPIIDPKTLKLPADVEMKILGSCIKFTKGETKAYLKGRGLEVNRIPTNMEDIIIAFDAKQIEKCHLGSSLGNIPSLTDNASLETILNKYFKSAKIKAPVKATKATKTETVTTPAATQDTTTTQAPVTETTELKAA